MRALLTVPLVALLSVASPAQVLSPVVDPFDDAVDTFGAGPPLLDIDTIDVHYDADFLYFSMTFHTPIEPASNGAPNSVVGVLEFDLDQSTATGTPPFQNTFSPPFARLETGVDALLILDDSATPGLFPLLGPSGPLDEIKANFGPRSLAGVVRLSTLEDDGLVDFTTIIGTFGQPTDATDVYGISVPEPATIGLMVAGAALLRDRRRSDLRRARRGGC